MGDENIDRKQTWFEPDNAWFFFKQLEYKYAKKMMDEGNIKFNCANAWVKIAKKYGQGQGDLYEGTFATCSLKDVKSKAKYIKMYDDVETQKDKSTRYFRRKSIMKLPVYCFYTLKTSAFKLPKEEGSQEIEAEIESEYFKDFARNMTKEQILALPEDERPAIVVIEDKLKFINLIKDKLKSMGVKESEIQCYHINYEFNFIKDRNGNFNCHGESSDELFYKDKSFEHQSETRIIVNTRNKSLIEKLKKPIDIGPINDISYISTNYFEGGMKTVMNAQIYRMQESEDGIITYIFGSIEDFKQFLKENITIKNALKTEVVMNFNEEYTELLVNGTKFNINIKGNVIEELKKIMY